MLPRCAYSRTASLTLGVVTLVYLIVNVSPVIPADRCTTSTIPARGNVLVDIANSTLGFKKIFAINLAHRTDKRDSMSLAAGLSGLEIEYVDGVVEVHEKALPPGGVGVGLRQAHLGNWRAHTNVIRLMVERNIASALILEDDADWDWRIQIQLKEFAKGMQLLLEQSISSTANNQPLDPGKTRNPRESIVEVNQAVSLLTDSPYGNLDHWDVLWLGHCGSYFPNPNLSAIPTDHAIILNDTTVPPPEQIAPMFGDSTLLTSYPPHTRLVSRAYQTTCTTAYALSQSGARKLLYELGIHKMTGPTDMLLREICDGTQGRVGRKCFTVLPALFGQHRAVGRRVGESDIDDREEGRNDKAVTQNIRWSVRSHFGELVDGNIPVAWV